MRIAATLRQELRESFDEWTPEQIAQYAYCRWVSEVARMPEELILEGLNEPIDEGD